MDTLENKITSVVEAQRSIDDIKANYPDEWILLGNPVKDEFDRTVSGVVLYHSPDKRELAYRDKPLLEKYDRTAHFFNRVTARPKRQVIASLYSTLKPSQLKNERKSGTLRLFIHKRTPIFMTDSSNDFLSVWQYCLAFTL